MTRGIRLVIVIVSLVIFTYLLVSGWDYYSSPYLERPRHEDYRELRPAGSYGLAYGYLGAAMMILMLTYSLRKRTRLLGRLFSLRTWLNLHIFLGIFGPLLILLHTSFKVQGLVAVAFWSMVAVALSGYLGRFLYQQIPRNLAGDELSLGELEESSREADQKLVSCLGESNEGLKLLRQLQIDLTPESGSTLRLLGELLLADIKRPLLRWQVRREVHQSEIVLDADLNEVVDLAVRRATLQRRVLVLERVQRLFHYWHVIHKPFAIIMYLIMAVHIGIAIWTGYTWIF